jgi:hypothetical protein
MRWGGSGLASFGSVQDPVVGSSEHTNRSSNSNRYSRNVTYRSARSYAHSHQYIFNCFIIDGSLTPFLSKKLAVLNVALVFLSPSTQDGWHSKTRARPPLLTSLTHHHSNQNHSVQRTTVYTVQNLALLKHKLFVTFVSKTLLLCMQNP